MNTKTAREESASQVTLLIGTGCSHCPVVLDALTRLLKEGRIARLEVINVTRYPREAADRGARSVPWIGIGPYHLQGAHTYGELLKWIENPEGKLRSGDYFRHLLETGRIEPVVEKARREAENRRALASLLASPETPMNVRIGIGAVFEELAEENLLTDLVDELLELTRSDDPKLRADVCHYLSLTRSGDALPRLREILQEEEDPQVREIAAESLHELQAALTGD